MGIGTRSSAACDVSDVVVEPATVVDLTAVAQIEAVAFSDPWSPRAFRDALRHSAVYFACARRRDDHHVLGYVVAWFVADEGEIANLAVAPDGWGRGIGKLLLDAALTEASLRGAEAIYLEVRDSNHRARRLYHSRAFEEVGRRQGYYRHPEEDAIVLRRTLR